MKILSFDVESDGIHGTAFAIGGCLIDANTLKIEQQLWAWDYSYEPSDPWVKQNVSPALKMLDPMFPNGIMTKICLAGLESVRYAFWTWLQEFKDGAIVVTDVGYPVEARLMMQCQDEDTSRAWQHPYPVHEVATLLLAAGVDPDVDRLQYAGELKRKVPYPMVKHNPLHDSVASALCAVKALHEVGLLF